MTRRPRIALALALVAAAAALPGCAISIGSSSARSSDDRLDQLSARMRAAEQKLGIPTPEGDR